MKFDFKGKEFVINHWLANQLDSMIYNIEKDWDFVVLITGDRTVRVGKSVLGQQVCAYLASRLMQMKLNKNPYTIEDIYFDNKAMMSAAYNKPKYCINHYDEGREGLDASKAMKSFQHDLLDFFAECGQLNQIFVIVMPDFFSMKEDIAVARSEFLINVYRKHKNMMVDVFKEGVKRPVVKLERGFFEFFARDTKKKLYDKARSCKRKDYGLIKANFVGNFNNQYPLGEAEYRKAKLDALKRFAEEKKKNEGKPVREPAIYKYLRALYKHVPINQRNIALESEGLSCAGLRKVIERDRPTDTLVT